MEMFQAHSTYTCRLYHLFIAFFVVIQVTKGTVFDQERSQERYYPKYNLYHNLSKLNECIHDLAVGYPGIVEVEMRYRSRWGLSQYLIHVSNIAKSHTSRKRLDTRAKVLLSFGEHSNEFFPVESMLNLLENITTGYDLPPQTGGRNFTTFILNNIDLYIVAIVNPDGRSIIEETGNYCWRHTSNQVDLNVDDRVRSEKGKTNQINRVVTEPECKFLSELLPKKFDAFLSFHSGKRGISIPQRGGTDGTDVVPLEIKELADQLSAIVSPGTPLTLVSLTDKVDYSIFSHVSSTKKVPFTYVISLWGNGKEPGDGAECFDVYNPQSEKLKESLQDVYPVYVTLFHYIHEWKKLELGRQAVRVKVLYNNLILLRHEQKSGRGMPYTTIIMFLVLFCVVVYLSGKYQLPLSWKMFYRRQRRIVSLRTLASTFI